MTEQLRVYCAQQISEMEQSVGCHQDLMGALNKTYPEQVDTCTPADTDTGTGFHHAVTLSSSYMTQCVCGCVQVVLNQAYVETLSSASALLSRTMKDQASLAEEVGWEGVRYLVSVVNLFLFFIAFWKTLGLILKVVSAMLGDITSVGV